MAEGYYQWVRFSPRGEWHVRYIVRGSQIPAVVCELGPIVPEPDENKPERKAKEKADGRDNQDRLG